ncbi:MAG TPA: glycosyltransferase, partial [Vicinamibacteria bacterium]
VPEGRVGHVVPSGDAAAMADRVVALLTDDARREEMGRAAREWVEREFSTGALARKTGAVYDEVLRRKAPGASRVR